MAVKKNGKTYQIRFNHNGQQIKFSAGKGATKEQAEELELLKRKELRDIDNGLIPDKSIEDALIKWLEEYVPHLAGASKYYSHARAIEPYIVNKPMKDIYRVAGMMKRDMQHKGLANATINRRLSVLKRVASLAFSEWRWLNESPYKKIESLAENNARDTVLTMAEVEKLADCAPTAFVADLIKFAACTGLRRAEIWRLDDDSLRGTDLHVKGKGHRNRTIPLHSEQAAFVRKWVPIGLTNEMAMRYFRMARHKADMEYVNFHDLRHTFGTWLAQDKQATHVIMRLMGHTTVQMANRYISLCTDDLREAMPKMPTTSPENRTGNARKKFKVVK